MFQLSTTGSKRARGYGTQHTSISKEQFKDKRAKEHYLWLSCKKLSHRYIGLFIIQRQISEIKYRLKLPAHLRISPSFHVSLLKLFTNHLIPSLPGSGVEDVPPPPVDPVEVNIY